MNPRIVVLICVLLGGMGQGVVAPKLPEILARSNDLNSIMALASGMSATLMYFGIFISTYQYGKLADSGRVHWLLAPGLLLYSVTLIVLGASTSTIAIFSSRFVEGLALSAVFVAADFVLGRLSAPTERGQWLSYYGVAMSMGLLLGPALALLTARYAPVSLGPLLPMAIVAAFSVLLGCVVLRLRIPKLNERSQKLSILNSGALASGAAYGFMEAGLVAVFPILAVREFGVRPEYCLFAVILAAAASSVLWGVLSDKVGPRLIVRLLLAGLACGPVALAAMANRFDGSHLAFASCICFGVLAGGLYPVGFSWLLDSLPESQYGFASGSFARAYGLGSLFGPLAVGLFAQYYGSRGMLLSMAVVGGLGLIATYALSGQRSVVATK